MGEKLITVTFSDEADPIVEVHGATGKSCLALTRDLECELGFDGDVLREKKREYGMVEQRESQKQTRMY